MRHGFQNVETEFEQIQTFVQFANKYKTDFLTPDLRHFLDMDLRDLFEFTKSKYLLEEGEQILRPKYFARIGGDCDDCTIWYLAAFLCAGVKPENLFIVLARLPGGPWEHIFCALWHEQKIIFLDNLPDSEFDKVPYAAEDMQFSRVTDYL